MNGTSVIKYLSLLNIHIICLRLYRFVQNIRGAKLSQLHCHVGICNKKSFTVVTHHLYKIVLLYRQSAEKLSWVRNKLQ